MIKCTKRHFIFDFHNFKFKSTFEMHICIWNQEIESLTKKNSGLECLKC